MKIAFVQTPAPYLVRQDAQMPLGILYLATMLKESGYNNVKIFRPKTIEDMHTVLDCGVVFFSATTLEYPMTCDCAHWIRGRNPSIKRIIGGTHVTATRNRHPVFDSICIGEGESAIGEMMIDILKPGGRLKPIYEWGRYADVNKIPIPDRSMIPGSHGGEIFSSGGEGRNENLITSRGCAFNCAFCASRSMWNGKIRFRSMENIKQELAIIHKESAPAPLRICDDNLTCSKIRLNELCEVLSGHGSIWRCSARAEDLTPETCRTMYQGGCREVSPGIESGDQDVLNLLNKKTTLNKMLEGCANAKKAGIRVRALFMIGTPGETLDTPKRNMDFIKKLAFDRITLSTFIPLPGTDIYKHPDKFNCSILSQDFSRYNKDYFIRKNGNAYAREYEPLIHNRLLTIEQMKDNVKRMEDFVKEYEVNKG